jgi:hypothetical protein
MSELIYWAVFSNRRGGIGFGGILKAQILFGVKRLLIPCPLPLSHYHTPCKPVINRHCPLQEITSRAGNGHLHIVPIVLPSQTSDPPLLTFDHTHVRIAPSGEFLREDRARSGCGGLFCLVFAGVQWVCAHATTTKQKGSITIFCPILFFPVSIVPLFERRRRLNLAPGFLHKKVLRRSPSRKTSHSFLFFSLPHHHCSNASSRRDEFKAAAAALSRRRGRAFF